MLHGLSVEYLFIKISLTNHTKFVICNIYRPGTAHPILTHSQQFENFMENVSNVLSLLPRWSGILILIYSRLELTNMFLITLTFSSPLELFKSLQNRPGVQISLIDHSIANNTCNEYVTFILTSKVSDHSPVIHFIDQTNLSLNPKPFLLAIFPKANLTIFKMFFQPLTGSL